MRNWHKWQGRWAFFRVALLSREGTIMRRSSINAKVLHCCAIYLRYEYKLCIFFIK